MIQRFVVNFLTMWPYFADVAFLWPGPENLW